MDRTGVITPWPRESSEYLADCRIFKVRKDRVTDPRTGAGHEMFVLEHPNWVNILPLTNDDQIVLVRQWRQGTRTVELETPGGMVDPGETPEDCARRELLEETGYQADTLTVIGRVNANLVDQTRKGPLAEACGSLVQACHGDDRPDCPIISGFAGSS